VIFFFGIAVNENYLVPVFLVWFPADNANFRREKSAQTSLAGQAGQRNLQEIPCPRTEIVDFINTHYLIM